MTAGELLWSIDGNARLTVISGLSTIVVESVHGGGSVASEIASFPGMVPNVILDAPARVKSPKDGFTDVVVDFDQVKRDEKMAKQELPHGEL